MPKKAKSRQAIGAAPKSSPRVDSDDEGQPTDVTEDHPKSPPKRKHNADDVNKDLPKSLTKRRHDSSDASTDFSKCPTKLVQESTLLQNEEEQGGEGGEVPSEVRKALKRVAASGKVPNVTDVDHYRKLQHAFEIFMDSSDNGLIVESMDFLVHTVNGLNVFDLWTKKIDVDKLENETLRFFDAVDPPKGAELLIANETFPGFLIVAVIWRILDKHVFNEAAVEKYVRGDDALRHCDAAKIDKVADEMDIQAHDPEKHDDAARIDKAADEKNVQAHDPEKHDDAAKIDKVADEKEVQGHDTESESESESESDSEDDADEFEQDRNLWGSFARLCDEMRPFKTVSNFVTRARYHAWSSLTTKMLKDADNLKHRLEPNWRERSAAHRPLDQEKLKSILTNHLKHLVDETVLSPRSENLDQVTTDIAKSAAALDYALHRSRDSWTLEWGVNPELLGIYSDDTDEGDDNEREGEMDVPSLAIVDVNYSMDRWGWFAGTRHIKKPQVSRAKLEYVVSPLLVEEELTRPPFCKKKIQRPMEGRFYFLDVQEPGGTPKTES